MTRGSPSIPVGRIRRGAKVGGLLGLETARVYATKAANVARSEQGRGAAGERRRLEAAEHVAEVLGQMKGAAMKAGQMASLMDFNGLPSGELDGFQARFEDLRDSAPRVPFKEIGGRQQPVHRHRRSEPEQRSPAAPLHGGPSQWWVGPAPL